MRIRWKTFALTLSLILNLLLIVVIFIQAIDTAHWKHDQDSTWRYLFAEQHQLSKMRESFCKEMTNPTRRELLFWEEETRPQNSLSKPFEKDGLLILRDIAVKLDNNDRLIGVCLSKTSQALYVGGFENVDWSEDSCVLESLC